MQFSSGTFCFVAVVVVFWILFNCNLPCWVKANVVLQRVLKKGSFKSREIDWCCARCNACWFGIWIIICLFVLTQRINQQSRLSWNQLDSCPSANLCTARHCPLLFSNYITAIYLCLTFTCYLILGVCVLVCVYVCVLHLIQKTDATKGMSETSGANLQSHTQKKNIFHQHSQVKFIFINW